jgi:hypothetical protein
MTLRILIISFFSLILVISAEAQTKIQSASWSINQSVAGFALDNNNGERIMTIDIKFDKPFNSKPKVYLSLIQIDASKETNIRYNIEAVSVSRDGFTLKVNTWSDSKIFSMSGNWLAYTE